MDVTNIENKDIQYWKDQLERITLIENQENAELERLRLEIDQNRNEIARLVNRERLEYDIEAPIQRERLDVEVERAVAKIKQILVTQADLQNRKRGATDQLYKAFVRESKIKLEGIET